MNSNNQSLNDVTGSDSQHDETSTVDVDCNRRVDEIFKRFQDLPMFDQAESAKSVWSPGKIIDDFEIIDSIGSGGMGTVFLAKQISLSRDVAIKLCRFESLFDTRGKLRFEAEGRALANINNPYVVPVIACGQADNWHYLVMEHVAGLSLADLLEALRTGKLNPAAAKIASQIPGINLQEPETVGHSWHLDRRYTTWAVELLRKVAIGLEAIHAAGIVHRDIKPANVVIDESGEPKIVDFGLARSGTDSTITRTGEFLGTPAYSSPEQLRGEQSAITESADLFSFGVLLYETLCLQRPFDGSTYADVSRAILASEPPYLRSVVKTISWELEAIAHKCLEKDPSARYGSAALLSEDLLHFLDHRPIAAKKTTPHRKLIKAARRRPWMAVSLMMFVLLSTVGWAAYAQARRISAEQASAQQHREYKEALEKGDASTFRLLAGERPVWMKSHLQRVRDDAIVMYAKAIALAPNKIWPLMQRGRLLASQDETLPLALEDFRRAGNIEPTFQSPKVYRDYVERKLSGSEIKSIGNSIELEKSTDMNDLYWLGTFSALVESDPARAQDFYSKCILLNPNQYWAWLERVLYSADPNTPAVHSTNNRVEQLRIAKSLRPDLPFASELLALILKSSDTGLYRAELQEQIDTFGLTVLRAHLLAELELDQGDFDNAKKILLRVKPEDVEGGTAQQIGDLSAKIGEVDESIRWYELAAAESKLEFPYLYIKLAAAYTERNRLAEAEDAHLSGIEAIRIKADETNLTSTVYLAYASFLEDQGRTDDAKDVYNELLSLPLTESQPYLNYANFYANRGMVIDAIEVLNGGIALIKERISESSDLLSRSILREELHRLQTILFDTLSTYGSEQQANRLFSRLWADRPFTTVQTNFFVRVLNQAGQPEAALLAARLGEFSESQNLNPTNINAVDTQLKRMRSNRERLERLNMRRSVGVTLPKHQYLELAKAQSDPKAVLELLKEGIDKYPKSYEIKAALALAYKLNSSPEQARKQLESAVAQYESEVEKLSNWASLSTRARPRDYSTRLLLATNPVEFLEACDAASTDGDASELVTRLRTAIAKVKKNPDNSKQQ